MIEKSSRRKRGTTEVDRCVGNRLRNRRMHLEFSQSYVADRLGISFQQIQKYERGTNRIGASRLWELAELLDVGVDWFFADVQDRRENFETKEDKDPITILAESQDGFKFAKAINAIEPGDVRRQLLVFARTLAGFDKDGN